MRLSINRFKDFLRRHTITHFVQFFLSLFGTDVGGDGGGQIVDVDLSAWYDSNAHALKRFDGVPQMLLLAVELNDDVFFTFDDEWRDAVRISQFFKHL